MTRAKIVHKYTIHHSMKDYQCFYCASHAESKDHIPPISHPENFEEEERFVVRCCILCNSLLGNRLLLTFLSRFDYLLIRYNHRFKRALSMPDWSDDEINELTGKLKRQVIYGLKKKKYIIEKLNYIQESIHALQGY